ncbi:MAG: hypothetical protein TE42_08035 [Candidatus Synechococcus spongiarum SP3]|uniref:Sigma factor SigF n=1 Tax=Candidatus Synechococcus spongiarum SP3 TaxID=1604020 RepID=A0A0G2HJV9_9SYNE|nr:MAG: hypothetical protein TE42_08035 [Candidatus Synechococcus spongiarum SP3]
MFPPVFATCLGQDWLSRDRHYKQAKLRMLKSWRDSLERKLAAVNSVISTLEEQLNREPAA